jgi:hypothetical protein
MRDGALTGEAGFGRLARPGDLTNLLQ